MPFSQGQKIGSSKPAPVVKPRDPGKTHETREKTRKPVENPDHDLLIEAIVILERVARMKFAHHRMHLGMDCIELISKVDPARAEKLARDVKTMLEPRETSN